MIKCFFWALLFFLDCDRLLSFFRKKNEIIPTKKVNNILLLKNIEKYFWAMRLRTFFLNDKFNYLMTDWWLPADSLMTARWLHDYCQMTALWLPDDRLTTSWWLPHDRLVTTWWPPDDLSQDGIIAIWWLFHNHLMTVWKKKG